MNGIEAIQMAAKVGQSIELMARGETHVVRELGGRMAARYARTALASLVMLVGGEAYCNDCDRWHVPGTHRGSN